MANMERKWKLGADVMYFPWNWPPTARVRVVLGGIAVKEHGSVQLTNGHDQG